MIAEKRKFNTESVRKISRTAGILPATVERYTYDGHQIVADVDSSDNLLSMTTYTNGGAQASATYYAIKDHQNTIIALTDSTGTIVESYEYDAYGRILDVKDGSGNSIANQKSAIGNRYAFQGREIDWTTGLYYFRTRWYNPESGRFISKDLIGISGGFNLYEFCDNNPVNFIDPFGLDNIHATGNVFFGAFEIFAGTVSEGVGFLGGMYGRLTNNQGITNKADAFADKATLIKREGMDRFSDAVREYGNPDEFLLEKPQPKPE